MLRMKRSYVVLLAVVMVLSVVLSACNSGNSGGSGGSNSNTSANTGGSSTPAPTQTPSPEPAAPKPEDIKGEIVVWGQQSFVDAVLPDFNKKYPNIKVTAESPDAMHDKFMTALASGTGAPDVIEMGSSVYWKYKAVDGLEDLLQPPYNAGNYQNDFTEVNWNLTMSLDNKRLYAMPWTLPPYVMFYRADLFEEAGYPSDPVEVGKFVADADNFFELAQALRAKGSYFFRWPAEVTEVASSSSDFYDHNLVYQRNTQEYVEAIDLAKRAGQLDIVIEVEREERIPFLKSGKLAVLFQNPGGIGWIRDAAKDEGKWRVTSLPFGKKPARGMASWAIPSQSKNKEAAWALVEWLVTSDEANTELMTRGTPPGYIPARSLPIVKDTADPTLGGQSLIEMAISMGDDLTYYNGQPLFELAEDIWEAKLEEALEQNKDSKAILQEIMDETEKAAAVEKEKLLKLIGK